jgi:hypothetical protein
MMKAVKLVVYGLKGRVQNRAARRGCTSACARSPAITYEIGLRSPSRRRPSWSRSGSAQAQRGLIMGRLAQRLGVDGWTAHSRPDCSRSAARPC